jgi:hypothetical protein
MQWNRSQAIALASDECSQCHGVGMITGKRGISVPCNCVLRGVFRACYGKFIECTYQEKHVSRARLEMSGGSNRRYSYGRKEEEFVADFFLVSRRTLDPKEFQVFRYHYLLGADWRLCSRRLKMERGEFFHMVYRIEQRLGRVFRELKPYALFPLDEYFGTSGRVDVAAAAQQEEMDSKVVPIDTAVQAKSARGRSKKYSPLRPPIRRVA